MKKKSTILPWEGFVSFMRQPDNRRRAWIISAVILVEFILFKLFYPFPSLFSDSYSYIFAAADHLDVNVWPIGYSKFLAFFPWITRSHLWLVIFQYLSIEGAAFYFYFTILYYYPLQRVPRRLLAVLLFANPLLIYMANYVTADALFIGISLLWVTQLIDICHRPRLVYLVTHTLILFLAFTVRFNAFIYPLISAFAFFISTYPKWAKAVGSMAGPFLIILFIWHSREAARDLTGTAQFPLLAGWQWGNNALYIREHIEVAPGELPSLETMELDRLAQNFIQTVPPEKRDLPNYVSNYFIRKADAPLRKYLHIHYQATDEYTNLISWGRVSPIYGDYGKAIIGHHPWAFGRYYLWVNTKNYLVPPLEQLRYYNLGQDTIWYRGQRWFQLPTTHVVSAGRFLQEPILLIFPPLFALINFFYLVILVALLWQKGAFMQQGFARSVLVVALFWLLNAGFSVFANIIVIRYEIFPMLLLGAYSVVVANHCWVSRRDGASEPATAFSQYNFL